MIIVIHDYHPSWPEGFAALKSELLAILGPLALRANVHVRIDGNPNQGYALLFRDYLRAHPNSARSIERIKREIAKRHAADIETYYDIKDPVYDLIWDAALGWAQRVGNGRAETKG